MFQIDKHLQPVVLQKRNRLPRHQQVLFGGRPQGARHIQQPRLHHHHRNAHPSPVLHHILRIAPMLYPRPRGARPAEERELHRPRVHILQRARQLAHKLVRPGKPDLRVAHPERAHPFQQPHRMLHRDLQVRLLQPIPQTRIEQLNLPHRRVLHLSPASNPNP
jgi:hypothetical protein